MEDFLLKGYEVKLTVLFRRSKAIKPADRQAKAYEIVRIVSDHLSDYGHEILSHRKVTLGSIRGRFAPIKKKPAKAGVSDTKNQVLNNKKTAVPSSALPTRDTTDEELDKDDTKILGELEKEKSQPAPEIHSVHILKREMATKLMKLSPDDENEEVPL